MFNIMRVAIDGNSWQLKSGSDNSVCIICLYDVQFVEARRRAEVRCDDEVSLLCRLLLIISWYLQSGSLENLFCGQGYAFFFLRFRYIKVDFYIRCEQKKLLFIRIFGLYKKRQTSHFYN